MTIRLEVEARHIPEIDPGFLPAVLWNRAFASAVRASRGGVPLGIALVRQDGTVFRHSARILPATPAHAALNHALRRAAREVPALAEGRLHGAGEGRRRDRARARAPLFGQGRPRLRPGLPGPPRVRRADRGARRRKSCLPRARRSARSGATSTAAGSASTSAAATARRPALVDGKVVFSDEVKWNPYFEKDPAYHLEGVNDSIRRAAAAPAADRRDRRQRGGRLREQRAARGLALPRHLGARLRPPHPRPVPRAAAVVGRRAVRGGERRRGDGARRLDVAALERRARHLARDQHGGRLRHARRQHHALAERARLRADRLPRGRAGRRVVGRPRRRRAVLLAAGGEPPAARGRDRAARRDAARRAPRRGAGADGEGRPAGAQDLRGDRRLPRLRHRALRRLLRDRERARAGPRHLGRRAATASSRPPRACSKDEFPALAERIRLRTPDEKEKRHGQAIAAASLPVAPPSGGPGGAAEERPPEVRPRKASRSEERDI